ICFELSEGDFGLDDDAHEVENDVGMSRRHQPRISAGRLVEGARVGEGLWVPGERSNPVANGAGEHRRVSKSGKVEVLGVVAPELTEADMVPAPQRYPVEIH